MFFGRLAAGVAFVVIALAAAGTARAAATKVSLDQARNGTAASPTNPVDFQNGNLGSSNSHFVESQSIPYRLVMTNLSPGAHTVTIGWDVRQGGRHAIDYVTHFNRMQPHGVFSPVHAAEVVNPLAGLSGAWGAPTPYAILAPSSAGSPVAGQPTASFGLLPPGERQLSMYNGTISLATYVSHGSLTAFQSETQLRIEFVAEQSNVVLAWGGHIASRLDWGVGNSAAQISGAPYHTRVIDLDGSGGNQDRSVQVDAIAVVEPVPCDLTGPDGACPGGLDRFATSTVGTTYAWAVVGDGTIEGAADGQSVDVRAALGCSGEYTVTLRQTDSYGNVTTCSRRVPIRDVVPPVVECPPDITIECGASIDPSNTGTPDVTDACDPNVTITFGDGSRAPAFGIATCQGRAPIERTWTVTDACGNTTTCVQLISFVDTTPPVITCPPDAIVECGAPFDPLATGTATATDGCDPAVTITFGDGSRAASFAVATCTPGTPIERTWTATDACGNTSTCVQLITFVDTTPPVITCPPDVAVECGGSIDPSATGTATATDGCDPSVTITFGDGSRAPGFAVATCSTGQPLERVWTATDDCGNTTTCVQHITFVDETPPVITCPADVVVECGASIDPTDTGSATAQDGCDPNVTITFGDGSRAPAFAAATCTPREPVVRTWTATDDCGNTSTCVQNITFVDTTPPVVTCPPDVSVQCGDSIDPSDTGTPTANDACDPTVTITFGDGSRALAGGHTAMTGCTEGTIERTWTVTDDCGNSSTCIQRITFIPTDCPRTAGFWSAQCAQAGTGATKYDEVAMTQIARRADDKAAVFSWPELEDFDGFCAAVVNTGGMDVRRQAKRQFATLLANVAVGELGLIAANGDQIRLGTSTPVSCPSRSATTVGALIGEVDALLMSLEGQPLTGSVKTTYAAIVSCLDGINNAVGLSPVCESAAAENALYRDPASTADAPVATLELRRPSPNPFTSATRISYDVPEGGREVVVAVFDVAGRSVRMLASGAASPGRHEVTWNGRDEHGSRVTSGVYFVRIATGDKAQTLPVVYLGR